MFDQGFSLDQELFQMLTVNHQDARDTAIYRAWVEGARQEDLAEQYQVQQPAISKAIQRVASALPAVEKDQEVRKAAAQADQALAVFFPKMLQGDTAASREARGWSLLKHRWLGMDRKELHVEGHVEHTWEPGPSVDQVLAQFLDQGKIRPRVELQRTDQ